MSNKYGPKIITDGLVLHLDAGDRKSYSGTGTTWYDRSKYKNHGTLTNGPTYNSGNGGSIVFDGADDYFITDLNTVGQSNTSFSFGGFFYNTTNTHNSTNKFIFSNYVIGLHDGFFAITTYATTPILRLWLRDSSRNNNVQSNGVIPQVGVWYHVMGVRNASNNTAQFYVNGELIHDYSYDGSVSVTDLGTSYFGGVLHNSSQIMPSTVSLVQLYSRALSAIEIQQNYNAIKGRFNL